MIVSYRTIFLQYADQVQNIEQLVFQILVYRIYCYKVIFSKQSNMESLLSYMYIKYLCLLYMQHKILTKFILQFNQRFNTIGKKIIVTSCILSF